MTDLELLDTAAATAGLRAAGVAARGFLGTDPITQNDALLADELTRLTAQVFRAGDTLVGCTPNLAQPRQAFVASTSDRAEPVRALLAFLGTYRRFTSYVAMVPATAEAHDAFTGCGFTRCGTLREHRYASGGYQDVLVYFVEAEDACLS
jgi:hypothetical protein